MKKRTLVCFLIFTLCVFYTAIPNTVFGQEEDVSLAQKVYDKHKETLQREDVQLVLPDVLAALSDPATLENPLIAQLGGFDAAVNLLLTNPVLIRQVVPDASDEVIALLGEEEIKIVFNDPDVRTLLQDTEAVTELSALLAAPPDDGTTPPDDGTTPPDDGTTPPDDGTTPPDDGTTPPDDGTTPPDDGTTPPDDGEIVPPPVIEQANPFDPIMPTNEALLGKSRLGGLSINRISGRKFLQDLLITATGLSIQELATFSGQTQDELVEMVVQLIPKEVPFTKKQIRAFLKSDNIPIFAGEIDQSLAKGLDPENFGNAITPMLLDLIYDDGMGDRTDPNRKYLTRNSLNLYVRVPSANVGSVTFSSSDGTLQKEGHLVGDPTVLGGEFISYTFRLEEALAATNLPAWPALEDELEQLFESVTLVYSSTLSDSTDDTRHSMQPNFGPNGVVWETTIDVTPGNSFYYYHVELADPLMLKTLDRVKLAELLQQASRGSGVPTISDILNATKTYTINEWSMPDPRNLQLADRGILDALFDENFKIVLSKAMEPLLAQVRSGTLPTGQELFNALGKNRWKLQNILLANAEKVTMRFEQAFDPMLSSVFSIPKVDSESESLWVAELDNIPRDRNYFVGAVVRDADGNPLDQMWSDITVDTKAPEADIAISAGNNTAIYENAENIYVATALEPGAATLKVTGIPKMGPSNYVGEGYGYLLYQIIGLNPDGTPYLGDSSLQRPNTWMPLTPEATVLASAIWDQTIAQLVRQGALPEEIDLSAAGLGVIPTENLTLDLVNSVLPLLATPLGLGFIENDPTLGPAIKGLGDFFDADLLDPKAINLLVEVFDATVGLIDHIPITYGDPNNDMMMLAQLGEDVLAGEYGIRALGIDTLFNVSSHTSPTRLRIVDSDDPAQRNRASITDANIGDFNNDGMVHPEYETGIIYANTKSVMITGTVTQEHPVQAIVIQYMHGEDWIDIGEATVMGTDFEYTWNVDNFEALMDAGDSVMVRAKAINVLQLEDLNPEPISIKLDPGIYPPKVLDLVADEGESQNPDSGAPQGIVTITASTEPLTGPETFEVQFEAKRPTDEEWIPLGTDNAIASAVGAAVDAAIEGATTAPISQGGKQTWSIEVKTTDLEDTITKGSPGARDASKDNNPYTVRAFAVDASGNKWPSDTTTMLSVDNVDDVAPLAPTSVSITGVDGVDVVFETEDGGYTVGGLVDKYDGEVPSPEATFMIEPVAERKTYTSVKFTMTDAAGTDSELEVAETAEDSGTFTVKVDVGALANGTYTFQALAYDEADNVEADTDDSKVSVTVENTFRPPPEILAITTDPPAETNPDSGAPKGIVTVNAYSIGEITSPLITSMRVEVKRQNDNDAAWKPAGTAEEGTVVTSEEVQELQQLNVDSLTDLIAVAAGNAATSTEASPIHRYQTYQKWTVDIDTVALELPDTIDKDSPAARDVSKDDNPYVVRAVAISAADEGETGSPEGVQSTFSLDNVDDVGPLGPTNIVAVADVAGMIEANEDGSYTVGGIVDDTVPSPIAIFTAEPTADPATYASANLVQTTEDSAETVAEGEAGVFDLTIDVGMLENGTYMFHALAVDESRNVQTDESPMVTVHVLNFRVSDVTEKAVIAVDGTDVPEPPAEPIPLRESVTVSFMVANGSLAAEELSGAVDGSEVPSESAEDPENTFSLKVEVGSLADGVYTPDGVITKRNGSVAFPLTTVNVDNTGPMVTIESPTEDATVESLPTIRATYHDGAGSGVDGATGSLALARLQPPNEAEVVVDQAELDKDAASLVYTRSEPLAGGAYRVTVQVTDNLGNVGEGSAEFAVNGTAPMVAIHSPASGQTFEHGEPLISGEFSGAGTVEVTTFTINDVDATPEVDGNRFSYTPEEGLGDGNHTVVVAVTDGDGNTAQTSVTFTVKMPKDTTPPVISAAAPNGVIKDADSDKLGAVVISAVVTDEQSAISSVKYSINGGVSRSVATLNVAEGKVQAPVDFDTHGPGLYTVSLSATSQGGTTNHVWTFTLILDNTAPTISSITPSGTFRGGLPVISASATDESGIAKITIAVMDAAGKEVKGKTADDGEDNVEGVTRLDFNPEAPLDEGTYTIEVRATDTLGNSATAKENFTIDFDTAAPVITMASPQNEARLTNRRPQISITYADAESGVDVDSIRFVFDDKLINLAPNQKSASQVMYTPPADLAFGQHTVKLEVSDMAHKEGNVSEKNKDARKANMAVYEFSFTVESEEGPVLASRPINAPNPFKENTRISFTLTRQSTLSIVIYDSTLRPVRVLVDNEVWGAGEYTGKAAIGWDGTSTSGEDLARGIYFCQIIVAESFEPEYVILKLALTR